MLRINPGADQEKLVLSSKRLAVADRSLLTNHV
jgi:hypothetical protein